MKKGLRSRIRTLKCPELDFDEQASPGTRSLQRHYAEGFDLAVRRVLEYMDNHTPLPEMLCDYVEDHRNRCVAGIHGDGRPGTVVSNAGFVLACSGILKLVHDEHGDQIRWAREMGRAEYDERI